MRNCAFHSLACIPPGRGMGNHLWTERFCRKSNLCLKVRIPDYLSLRTSPLKWCGNPPVRKEMYRKAPQKWESPRFLEVIVPGSIQPGDCHDQCALLSRNDRKFGDSPTNTNLSVHRWLYQRIVLFFPCEFRRILLYLGCYEK